MQVYEGNVCPPGPGKIAIVVARFNATITERLLEGAVRVLRENSVNDEDIWVVRVPGAFELPTLAQRLALDENVQAVICLGCVIKGETTHDEHINRAVSLELARIGAENGIPIIFGLLTCNTVEQALARSGQAEQSHDKVADPTVGNKGAEAAASALEMLHVLRQLPELEEEQEEGIPESIIANATRYSQGDFDADSFGDADDFDDEDEFEEFDDFGDVDDKPQSGRESKDKRPAHDGRGGFSKGKGSFGKKSFGKGKERTQGKSFSGGRSSSGDRSSSGGRGFSGGKSTSGGKSGFSKGKSSGKKFKK